MARKLSIGVENGVAAPTGSQAVTYDQNLDPKYWPTIQTDPAGGSIASGAGRINGSSLEVFGGAYLALTSLSTDWVLGRKYFLRFYVNPINMQVTKRWLARINLVGGNDIGLTIGRDATPPANVNTGTWAGRVQICGNKTISGVEDSIGVGGYAAADYARGFPQGQWLRVEMSWTIGTGSVDTFAWRVEGVDRVSVTGQNFGDGLPLSATGNVALSLMGPQTPANSQFGPPDPLSDMLIDDIALNDDQGSDQNTWPGDGHIVHCMPLSDNARVNWTGGAGGTTNLYDAINNKPPSGAVAPGSNLSQIRNPVSGATADYDANMQTYTVAGLLTGATVKVTQAHLRHGAESTTSPPAGAVRVVSNPADGAETAIANVIGFTTAGVAVAIGAETTSIAGWRISSTGVVYNATPTFGTAPVVRAGKRTASSRVFVVDLMWLLVEYVPRTYTVGLSETVTGSEAAVAARRKTIDNTPLDYAEMVMRDNPSVYWRFDDVPPYVRDKVDITDTTKWMHDENDDYPTIPNSYQQCRPILWRQRGSLFDSVDPDYSVGLGGENNARQKMIGPMNLSTLVGPTHDAFVGKYLRAHGPWSLEVVFRLQGLYGYGEIFNFKFEAGYFQLAWTGPSAGSCQLQLTWFDSSNSYQITGPSQAVSSNYTTPGPLYHVFVTHDRTNITMWVNGTYIGYQLPQTSFVMYPSRSFHFGDSGKSEIGYRDFFQISEFAFYPRDFSFGNNANGGPGHLKAQARYALVTGARGGSAGELAPATDSPRVTLHVKTGNSPNLTYSEEVAADSPWAYWKMEEANALDLPQDSSGNARHATAVTGDATNHFAQQAVGSGGVTGEACVGRMVKRVSGASPSFTMPLPIVDAHLPYSIEVWAKQANVNGYYQNATVYLLTTDFQYGYQHTIRLWTEDPAHLTGDDRTRGATFIRGREGDVSNNYVDPYENIFLNAGVGTVFAGTWYHYVFTFDGTYLRSYINGKLTASKMSTASLWLPDIGIANYWCYAPGVNETTYTRLAVYTSALSLARVQAHYGAGVYTPAQRRDVLTPASDAVTYFKPKVASVSESIPLGSEVVTRVMSYLRAIANTVTGVDSLTIQYTGQPQLYTMAVAESAPASDAATRQMLWLRAIANSITGTADALTFSKTSNLIIAQAAPAVDTVTRLGTFMRLLTETTTMSDLVVVSFNVAPPAVADLVLGSAAPGILRS